jgi:nitrate reductase NapE component
MKKRTFELKDFLFLAAVIIPFVILMIFIKIF